VTKLFSEKYLLRSPLISFSRTSHPLRRYIVAFVMGASVGASRG
jgi:hypothetical protein